MLKKLGIGIAAIFVIVLLFNSVLMPWYVKHKDTDKVPNVVGLNFIEGKKVLEDAGFEIMQGDVRYDDAKPIGLILDQNPPADQVVKVGRRIYLTVCGGEQLIEVPKLTGRSLRDAKFTLEQRGLEVGETVKKFSNEFPEDAIISQIVQPGSKVKRATKIDLIVSNGAELGPLRIPDLIGKKLEEAKKIIEGLKLKVGKITYQPSGDVPPGQVLEQYPQKEKSATENTTVDLFISKKRVTPVEPLDEELLKGDEDNNDSTTPEKQENDKDKKESLNKENLKSGQDKDATIKKDKDKEKKKPVPKKKEEPKPDKDSKDKNSGF